VGSSFSQFSTGIWTLKPPESLIHIDIDPYEIGKLISAKVGIIGDARAVLRQMLSYLETKVSKQDFRLHGRFPEIERRRKEYLDTQTPLFESDAKPIHPMRIMKELRDALPDNAIITADSGQNAHWVKRGFMARGPRTTIIDSRYAILGFGFPAALGAKLARPDVPVVCFTGDGGFYYHAMELSTAVEQNIPVVVVIDNNGFYNSNKSLCDIYYEGRRIWVDLPKTNWVGLAKSLGANGERVDNPGDIGAAIRRGIASGQPYVIDVATDPQVYPKRSMGQTHRMRWDIAEPVKKK
jgi:acetolactate synthase-1/2/3 large subunit